MNSATAIRQAIAEVARLRAAAASTPALKGALGEVKSLQASRFAGTYSDFLGSTLHGPATRFFLEDLYGNLDYADRDRQFARIAGSLQSFFPEQVVATAVALAELHAQTEQLDHAMASAWIGQSKQNSRPSKYVSCWRHVGATSERYQQLETVIRIGQELDSLTKTPGLRMTLRMMRGPAKLAGLSALQSFLEKGFDNFANMSRSPNGTSLFLSTIRARESNWIEMLCQENHEQAAQKLAACVVKIVDSQ